MLVFNRMVGGSGTHCRHPATRRGQRRSATGSSWSQPRATGADRARRGRAAAPARAHDPRAGPGRLPSRAAMDGGRATLCVGTANDRGKMLVPDVGSAKHRRPLPSRSRERGPLPRPAGAPPRWDPWVLSLSALLKKDPRWPPEMSLSCVTAHQRAISLQVQDVHVSWLRPSSTPPPSTALQLQLCAPCSTIPGCVSVIRVRCLDPLAACWRLSWCVRHRGAEACLHPPTSRLLCARWPPTGGSCPSLVAPVDAPPAAAASVPTQVPNLCMPAAARRRNCVVLVRLLAFVNS